MFLAIVWLVLFVIAVASEFGPSEPPWQRGRTLIWAVLMGILGYVVFQGAFSGK